MAEPGPDETEQLRYVCDMLEQLKKLSARSGGPFLVYLIDMARTEALGRMHVLGQQAGSTKQRDPAA